MSTASNLLELSIKQYNVRVHVKWYALRKSLIKSLCKRLLLTYKGLSGNSTYVNRYYMNPSNDV